MGTRPGLGWLSSPTKVFFSRMGQLCPDYINRTATPALFAPGCSIHTIHSLFLLKAPSPGGVHRLLEPRRRQDIPMLPFGLPALIVLPTAAGASYCFASRAVERLGGLQHLKQLAVHSIMLCGVSAVYWVWASYKLLALHDPDLGVVSFLIAFVMSYRTADLCAVQVRLTRRTNRPTVTAQRWTHPLALCLVVLNYMFGLYVTSGMDLPLTWPVYLISCILFWCWAAARTHLLLASVPEDATAEQQGLSASDSWV